MDHDHHTLWNALCEACGLIYHSALGNENSGEHEEACMDFLQRFRSHKDMRRMQRTVIKSNEVVEQRPVQYAAQATNWHPQGPAAQGKMA